jgi:hypothetical protein
MRGEVKLSPQQMRAMIELLPFHAPKLSAVGVSHLTGHSEAAQINDFGWRLASARSGRLGSAWTIGSSVWFGVRAQPRSRPSWLGSLYIRAGILTRRNNQTNNSFRSRCGLFDLYLGAMVTIPGAARLSDRFCPGFKHS